VAPAYAIRPALAKINKGEAYYGDATVLARPYVTGYEPTMLYVG
jgi:hypothetical protein